MSQKPSLVRAFFRKILDIFWESQGVPSAADAISAHASTDKKAKVLVSITCIIFLTCTMTLFCKGCYDESEIRDADSNARAYQNQLSEAERSLTEKDSQLLTLQSDYNESKREKDVAISKLTSERDDALSRVSQWETAPSNTASISSIADSVKSITNKTANLKIAIQSSNQVVFLESV